MKNPKFPLTVILLAIIIAKPIPHAYSSTLTLTVFTSKSSYIVTEDINIYGNLTYNDSPVPDWPVALEVQDPYGTTVVTRTPQTDTSGTYNLTFKLQANSKPGTYTAYVSSNYKGETATNNTTFELMPRDIAVTNITLSKTVIAQGHSMNTNVTVENQGYPTETFNVTPYANTTIIATITNITLTSGNSTTITFTWNTSGFARAYIISANITILPGETDTADNTLVYGIVKVSCIGDINGDYVTDGQDYQLVKRAVPSSPGSPKWNPNAELNDDGVIDGQDFQTVKSNIGQHQP